MEVSAAEAVSCTTAQSLWCPAQPLVAAPPVGGQRPTFSRPLSGTLRVAVVVPPDAPGDAMAGGKHSAVEEDGETNTVAAMSDGTSEPTDSKATSASSSFHEEGVTLSTPVQLTGDVISCYAFAAAADVGCTPVGVLRVSESAACNVDQAASASVRNTSSLGDAALPGDAIPPSTTGGSERLNSSPVPSGKSLDSQFSESWWIRRSLFASSNSPSSVESVVDRDFDVFFSHSSTPSPGPGAALAPSNADQTTDSLKWKGKEGAPCDEATTYSEKELVPQSVPNVAEMEEEEAARVAQQPTPSQKQVQKDKDPEQEKEKTPVRAVQMVHHLSTLGGKKGGANMLVMLPPALTHSSNFVPASLQRNEKTASATTSCQFSFLTHHRGRSPISLAPDGQLRNRGSSSKDNVVVEEQRSAEDVTTSPSRSVKASNAWEPTPSTYGSDSSIMRHTPDGCPSRPSLCCTAVHTSAIASNSRGKRGELLAAPVPVPGAVSSEIAGESCGTRVASVSPPFPPVTAGPPVNDSPLPLDDRVTAVGRSGQHFIEVVGGDVVLADRLPAMQPLGGGRCEKDEGAGVAIAPKPSIVSQLQRGDSVGRGFGWVSGGLAERQRASFLSNPNELSASVGASGAEMSFSSRVPSLRRRPRVSFKERMEIVLPVTKSLRSSASSLLEFRNPTVREQGKEMMPTAAEVCGKLLHRNADVCSVVVVDEDAVRKPCLVASGFSVRIYEDETQPISGQANIVHPQKMVGSTKASGGHLEPLPPRIARALALETPSDTTSAPRPSTQSPTLLSTTKQITGKESPSLSTDTPNGVSDSSELSDFDQFVHKFDVDEALSRRSGAQECTSVVMGSLQNAWIAGSDVSVLLGNSKGRNMSSFGIAKNFVSKALTMLGERLKDSASYAEVEICMGEVADADQMMTPGRVVFDLLADFDAKVVSDSDSSCNSLNSFNNTAIGSDASDSARYPAVELVNSPLYGTVVEGLKTFVSTDATKEVDLFERALTSGFLHYSSSSYSRSSSLSTLSYSQNTSGSGKQPCVSFAVLRLKTVRSGVDRRSAPCKAARGLPSETTSCKSDVSVSSLLLIFFGTEHAALAEVLRSHSVNDGAACHLSGWHHSSEFLTALTRSALGGRTRTAACLSLSEYDRRAALWLRVLSDVRLVQNKPSFSGDPMVFLKYLREQCATLDTTKGGHSSLPLSLVEGDDLLHNRSSLKYLRRAIADLEAFLANPRTAVPLLERLELTHEDELQQMSSWVANMLPCQP